MECEIEIKYDISIVSSEKDVKAIQNFFYSTDSFDDRNLTPGEWDHIKKFTFDSIKDNYTTYWYAKNKDGNIIGALGVIENEHKTGGYKGDFCVIHKNYRKIGLASEMHRIMFDYMKTINARYLIIETVDTKYYKGIRSLLTELGFTRIGYCPDYYFEDEGLILYLKDFTK